MAKKKNSVNVPALVITGVAVLFAAAAVTFLLITFSDRSGGPVVVTQYATDNVSYFTPTQELITEVETAAYNLLPKNYKIYQYFTNGMGIKEEPYGNLPEDGFYTCVNDEYKTFDELCELIRSTYVDKTASTLISDPFGYGPVYGDDNGELGLSVNFKERESSGLSWEETKYVCNPISETECDIEITLKDKDGKDAVLHVKMVKENDAWRLSEMIG